MKRPDWEKIESFYRVGLLSIREIASNHNVSEGAIRKRAKKEEWTRDLSKKITDKTESLVRTKEVRTKVRTETVLSERVLIEATAEIIANVRMEHRGDIQKARGITNTLLDELLAECSDIESLKDLGELMLSPDEHGRDKLNEIYHSIIGMPERVKSMKALSESMKGLIALERQAYGIDKIEQTSPDGSLKAEITLNMNPQDAANAYKDLMGG